MSRGAQSVADYHCIRLSLRDGRPIVLFTRFIEAVFVDEEGGTVVACTGGPDAYYRVSQTPDEVLALMPER